MATCSSCGKETDVKSYVIEVGNQKQSKILCQGCAECVEKSGIRIYEGTYSQNTGLISYRQGQNSNTGRSTSYRPTYAVESSAYYVLYAAGIVEIVAGIIAGIILATAEESFLAFLLWTWVGIVSGSLLIGFATLIGKAELISSRLYEIKRSLDKN